MRRFVNMMWVLAPVVFFLAMYYGLLIFFSSATDRHNINIKTKIDNTVTKVSHRISKVEKFIFPKQHKIVNEPEDFSITAEEDTFAKPACKNKTKVNWEIKIQEDDIYISKEYFLEEEFELSEFSL